MSVYMEHVQDFLAQRHIAVAGVTRSRPNEAANAIYRKLKNAGYRVYAINPNAEQVEGDPCYPDVQHLPESVDGIVLVTKPDISEKLTEACIDAGIRRIWMHRSFGEGSVSTHAVEQCLAHGVSVIAGGCPMMFCEPVDVPHKCIRWLLRVGGKLPR